MCAFGGCVRVFECVDFRFKSFAHSRMYASVFGRCVHFRVCVCVSVCNMLTQFSWLLLCIYSFFASLLQCVRANAYTYYANVRSCGFLCGLRTPPSTTAERYHMYVYARNRTGARARFYIVALYAVSFGPHAK